MKAFTMIHGATTSAARSRLLSQQQLVQHRRQLFNLPNIPSFDAQAYTIKKRINHPSNIMFEVVSNVSEYHKFVPYCTHSFVNQVDSNQLPSKGGLQVGFKEFNEQFVCRIQCRNDGKGQPKCVEAESLSDNLFDHLRMKWLIFDDEKRKNSSKMILDLDYKFSNPLYNSVSSLFSSKITEIMIKAFSQRAAELRKQRNL